MKEILHTTECSTKLKLILITTPIVLLGLDNKSPTFVNARVCLLLLDYVALQSQQEGALLETEGRDAARK